MNAPPPRWTAAKFNLPLLGSALLFFAVASPSVAYQVSPPVEYVGIGGRVTYNGNGLAGVTFSGCGSGSRSGSDGAFSVAPMRNATCTLTPSLAGYTFSPASRSFSDITADQTDIDFTAQVSVTATLTDENRSTQPYYAGDTFMLVVIGAANQTVSLTETKNGTVVCTNSPQGTTNSSGMWNASARWQFSDEGTYAQTWYVNGVAAPQLNFTVSQLTVSGTVTWNGSGLSGVSLGGVTTGSNGSYSAPELAASSPTLTPTKTGYTFSPPSVSFSNIESNQTQNFTATQITYTISGTVTVGGTGLYGVTLSGCGSGATTNSSGAYSITVPQGTSCTLTAALGGYTLSPVSVPFNNITSNQTQNFTATSNSYTISGTVTWNSSGLAGVSTGISGCASTNSSGYYSCAVSGGGNYTVTPTLAGYTFSPVSKSFNDITGNNTQNFTATQITYTISGTVTYNSSGLSGVSLSGCGSGATTNSSGAYSITVGSGTSCTLTPSLTGYSFSPSSKSFSNITSNQTQNFTATLVTYTISGTVTYNSSGLSGVTLSGCGSGATTNSSGAYSITVTQGTSCTLTPSLAGYTFSPASGSFTNITSNQTQNFTATAVSLTISGTVTYSGSGLSGVLMSGSCPSQPMTGSNGSYSITVPYGTTCTLAPSMSGYYAFTPTSVTFTNITSSKQQNFTATPTTYTISGTVTYNSSGLSGVSLSGCGSGATTNGSGGYSISVTYGTSCALTPALTGYTFTPPSASFNNISGNQTQNFAASQVSYTISGTVTVGSSGAFGVSFGASGCSTTNSSGQYSCTLAAGGNYTLTPSLAGYSFTPVSATFNNLSSSQTQNFTATQITYTISGTVTSGGTGLSGVTLSGCGSGATTNSGGAYSIPVSYGTTCTLTPALTGYTFAPASASFTNITGNQAQNFTATLVTYTISGTVTYNSSGLSGVSLSGCGGGTTTNSGGAYSITVGYGTSCTVTPALPGYCFAPPSFTISNITGNQAQNFTAAPCTYTITGTVTAGGAGLSGAALSGCGSGATSGSTGAYSMAVSQGTSCTLTPSLAGFTFSPTSNPFNNITSNQTAINFTAGATVTATLSVSGPQSGTTYYAGDSFTLTVNGPPNQPVTIYELKNGQQWASGQVGTTNSSGVWTTSGTWQSTDAATYSETWSVANIPAPALNFTIGASALNITQIVPSHATRGSQVTLNGAGFGSSQSTSTVTFDGADAGASSSWSDQSITVTVPPGAAPSGSSSLVTVTVGGVSSSPFGFTVDGPVIQSALSYSTSAASYGTSSGTMSTKVEIKGTGFGANQDNGSLSSRVTFDGIPVSVHDHTLCNDGCDWSDTVIHVQVPEGVPQGPGNVVVTVNNPANNPTSQGSNAVQFTIVPPSITSVSNSQTACSPAGSYCGYFGDTITITGQNFGADQIITGDPVHDDAVTFHGLAGPSVHDHTNCNNNCSWADQSINIEVPVGALSGNLEVLVDGMASNAVPFTVLSPTITQLSVQLGSPGAAVTISGVNFGSSQGQSTVYFNSFATAPVISWSDTSISVTVPANAISGPVEVVVGTHWSNGAQFTVPGTEPAISSLSPPAGPVGSQVTISGGGFGSSGTVTFNGVQATVQSGGWSATSILATVPSGATTGNVTVNTNGLVSNAMPFTVTSAPVIEGISPASGKIGMLVAITGARFGSTAANGQVTFGGQPAAAVTAWSDTAISAVVPNGLAAGTQANVVVTVNSIPSVAIPSAIFTVTCCGAAPFIDGISPNWANPGTSGTLSILGGNLAGVNQVGITPVSGCGIGTDLAIGAVSVAPDGSSLTAPFTVCASASSGARLLTVSNGVDSSNALAFTVGEPPPQISTITPSPWPVGPAIPVTISGVGFSNSPNVLLDDPNASVAACGTGGVGCPATCPAGSTPDTCFSFLATVGAATLLGGTHVIVQSSSGVQSPAVPINYQFADVTFSRAALWQLVMSGSPTPAAGWTAVVVPGADGAPTVAYPAPPDPSTLVMNFLAPPNTDPLGRPVQGGAIQSSEQYETASGLYAAPVPLNVATFGMSCYGYANEPDWGTPPDNCLPKSWDQVLYQGSSPAAPPGTLPQRSYCNSFLKDLSTQGSGYLADGTRVHYSGNGIYDVLATDFTTHDGTPLVPWRTLARDLGIIPGTGNLVDLDTIGDGLLADDVGGDVSGWRLDIFGGLDTACQSYANPIVVGACNPGDPVSLTCPPRLPQSPARACPAMNRGPNNGEKQ